MDLRDLVRRDARWPLRLKRVCGALQTADPAAEDLRQELCLLLHSGLRRYLELHASRMSRVDPDDLDDLCSEKALELFRRAESGEWRVDDRDGPEIAAFLSTVARNALLKFLGRRGREVVVDLTEESGEIPLRAVHDVADPAGADEFARAVVECAKSLKDRDRLIWMLRVFHELSSRKIAEHREVELKPSHIDVVLQRVRKLMSECLQGKGHAGGELPAGAFVALWTRFREGALPGPVPNLEGSS